ncbi:ABC transporter permease subunit [Actinomadura rudentiformis]|uniref:DUF1349 domain-containing protein n=1 Tax=Actinomadura rudentiformis TaxID=359158 RepID=A0A6H9Z0J9_9ACTN|nr:ABC transporter permease subunit [Actinomadura rudentiformis]KAB2350235.1 DUF1349 domain-containing protein [Actinomadura rudentiformis]
MMDGFPDVMRAEWTKFRSVPVYLGTLLGAAGLMVLFAVLISSGSPGTYDQAPYVDRFRFTHRPLTGDGSIVARVAGQRADHPWAMAGVMIKESATAGAPYAVLAVTRGHGIRLQARFTTDIAGSDHKAPHWLKLTRAGTVITGYTSTDGSVWRPVGTVTMTGLPSTVEMGLFATSPGAERAVPMRPVLMRTRPGTAVFDNVSVTAPGPPWRTDDIGGAGSPEPPPPLGIEPTAVTVTTPAGDIIGQADDGSRVIAAVAGSIAGLLPLLALGSAFVTAEYEHGLIRTTFAARPGRVQVLAAKAVVLAATVFTTTLVAGLAAFLITQPLLRLQGFRPPTYPDPSLADPTVLRVLVGTAAFLTLGAVLALGVGAILRHTAAAVTTTIVLAMAPVLVTPMAGGPWPQRLGPLAGLSIQQIKETDDAFLLPWAGRTWTGFTLLCAYAAFAFAGGCVLMRRRDP